MKILIVAPHFPPRYIGGVEMYTKRLADMLLARGECPEVVAVENLDATQTTVKVETDGQYGYSVHRLSGAVVSDSDGLGSSYANPECQRAVDEIVAASTPDVLHLHSGYLLGGPTLTAARLRNIPVITTLHDYWFICPRITLMHPNGAPCSGPDSAAKCTWCRATEKRRYRVPDAILRGHLGRAVVTIIDRPAAAFFSSALGRTVRAVSSRQEALLPLLGDVDVVLSPSHFLRDQMIRAGLPATRIQVCRYGIDVPAIERSHAGARNPLRIGYLGQIAPHKGVHHLVEAVRLLSDSIIVSIHGDLSREPRYVERLRRLAQGDPRIVFRGPYVHEQVYEVLAELDVIVVPSIWYENAPFVIQEAQAAGVPVVASRLGGMQELVADERYGLLFQPGSANDLARQLRRLIEDPGLVERLRPNAGIVRSLASEFEELHEHYERLSAARVPRHTLEGRTPLRP